MATYTVYATTSGTPGTNTAVASLTGYYDAVSIYYPTNSVNTTNVPVWVTTNGAAAVAGGDDSVAVYPGQTVVIDNQEGIWYQGEATVQFGSHNQWGQSLNGGAGPGARSNPGTVVNALNATYASQNLEIIGF
jgi:hypothetical protein